MNTPATAADRLPLWSPSPERVRGSQMFDFQQWLLRTRGVETVGYRELHAWSVSNLTQFWAAVWEYYGVVASVESEAALRAPSMPGTEWFPGVRLNYAENLLRHAATQPDVPAVIGVHEQRASTSLSWRQLEANVASLAAELRALGVRPGDRVAAVLPHIPQTVVALLATASVGAIWSVVNTDYGVAGITDRFAQIEPKVLFTVDGYEFNGRLRDQTGTIGELRAALPSVEHVIVVDQCGDQLSSSLPPGSLLMSALVRNDVVPAYEQLPFEHPLWVLYSSGTTGKPKGIMHSHGGIILETLKANGLHYDLRASDRAYFAVSTTWVVWNMVVATMMRGASIVTYDGSPVWGGPTRQLEICAEYRATFFGTGAAVLTMMEKSGASPAALYDLSALKTVLVTGSPLPESTWDWAYANINPNMLLGSDSGGTDVATAFIGQNPLEPVFKGELQGAYLGVDAQSWNSDGARVYGEVGEFVITQAMPSMPVGFFNDKDNFKYFSAYFDVFPGVWRHGDWVTETSGGQFVIHGRSDATINRGGIRMGSADISQTVDAVPGVASSMVIGAELKDGGYYMPLFVVPTDGRRLTEELREAIVHAIRTHVSPRYVPDEIIEAPALPRTHTGKIMEIPVKQLFQGSDPANLNRGACADATVLDWYAERALDFCAASARK